MTVRRIGWRTLIKPILYPQGVRAVIAESYERIHRSNLAGMGIVPLQYQPGETADTLKLTGKEKFTVDLPAELTPGQLVTVKVRRGITD